MFVITTVLKLNVFFLLLSEYQKNHPSPILAVSHTITVGTMLNFKGGNNGHGLKNVTRKQIFRWLVTRKGPKDFLTFRKYLMYFQASLVMATVLEKFALDFDISQHVLVVDAHLAMSPDLKTLRTMLGEIKNDIVQVN